MSASDGQSVSAILLNDGALKLSVDKTAEEHRVSQVVLINEREERPFADAENTEQERKMQRKEPLENRWRLEEWKEERRR